MGSIEITPEALFLDVSMLCHDPRTVWYKYLNIGRHESLMFRLLLGESWHPRLHPKIGPRGVVFAQGPFFTSQP